MKKKVNNDNNLKIKTIFVSCTNHKIRITILGLIILFILCQLMLWYTIISYTDNNNNNNPNNNNNNNKNNKKKQQKNNNEEPYRPTMVIHVGPSKTGTTTIQNDLEDLQGILQHDNYIYEGKTRKNVRRQYLMARMLLENRCFNDLEETIYNILLNQTTAQQQQTQYQSEQSSSEQQQNQQQNQQQSWFFGNNNNNMNNNEDHSIIINNNIEKEEKEETITLNGNYTIPREKITKDIIYQAIQITECYHIMLKQLNMLRTKKISIILSDEGYSYRAKFKSKSKSKTTAIYTSKLYFDILKNYLLKDWNVIIVVTYRRFAEWSISSMKELHYKQCLNPSVNLWPHQGGKKCDSTWGALKSWNIKRLLQTPVASGYRYIDGSIHVWKDIGNFTVKILNMHETYNNNNDGDTNSTNHHIDLTKTLVCDLIPNTPKTCDFVKTYSSQVVYKANAKYTDPAAYDTIVFEAADRGFMDTYSYSTNNANGTNTIKTTTISILDKATRHGVGRGLEHYFSNNLQFKNGLLYELPKIFLMCPYDDELEVLLDRSLELEQQIVPEFYYTGGKEQHITNFWKVTKQRRELCSINTNLLLFGLSTWDQVLQRLYILVTTNITNATQLLIDQGVKYLPSSLEEENENEDEDHQQDDEDEDNNNNNNNNNNKKYRPTITINVGPSKKVLQITQNDLNDLVNNDILVKDNYIYEGRIQKKGKDNTKRRHAFVSKFMQQKCFNNLQDTFNIMMNNTNTNTNTHNTNNTNNSKYNTNKKLLKIIIQKTKCWSIMSKELRKLRKKKQNGILADISYSFAKKFGLFASKNNNNKDNDNNNNNNNSNNDGFLTSKLYFDALHILFQDWNVIIVVTYERYMEF